MAKLGLYVMGFLFGFIVIYGALAIAAVMIGTDKDE